MWVRGRITVGLGMVVLAVGAVVLAGCGEGETKTADESSPRPASAETQLEPCPTGALEKGLTAAAYKGSVSGIDCKGAGEVINRQFAGAFIDSVSNRHGSYRNLEAMEPGRFSVGGFDCNYGRHDPRSGWPVECQRNDQLVAFTLSP